MVASTGGTFAPASGIAEGDEVGDGQVIGAINTRQGAADVAAHRAGVLTEWLAGPDAPVAPGQPLARIGGQI